VELTEPLRATWVNWFHDRFALNFSAESGSIISKTGTHQFQFYCVEIAGMTTREFQSIGKNISSKASGHI
jgi:hypothetical protein